MLQHVVVFPAVPLFWAVLGHAACDTHYRQRCKSADFSHRGQPHHDPQLTCTFCVRVYLYVTNTSSWQCCSTYTLMLLHRVRILPRLVPGSAAILSTMASTSDPSHIFRGPGANELINQSCGGACTRYETLGSISVAHSTKQLAILIRDTPAVPAQDMPELLAAIPAWQLSADGKSIHRAFVAKNFVQGVCVDRGVVYTLCHNNATLSCTTTHSHKVC